jgi:hypothetical protein
VVSPVYIMFGKRVINVDWAKIIQCYLNLANFKSYFEIYLNLANLKTYFEIYLNLANFKIYFEIYHDFSPDVIAKLHLE